MTDPVAVERRDLHVLLAVAREYLRACTPAVQPLPEGYEYRDVQAVVSEHGRR